MNAHSNHLLRWSGVGAAVALFAGLGMLGDTPDTRDSTEQIAAYFVAHRTSLLVGAVVVAAAFCAFLLFASALGQRFAGAGSPTHGRALQSAATVIVSLVMTLMVAVYVALAYVVGQEAPQSAKALFEFSLIATPLIAVPLALFYAMAAWLVVRGGGSRWFACVTAVLSVTSAVAAVSFAARGFFSPDVQQQFVFETFIVWIATASIVLARRPSS